jgi:hypothetical protein
MLSIKNKPNIRMPTQSTQQESKSERQLQATSDLFGNVDSVPNDRSGTSRMRDFIALTSLSMAPQVKPLIVVPEHTAHSTQHTV